jgi:hypothetical protein
MPVHATYDNSCDQLYIYFDEPGQKVHGGVHEILPWMRFDRTQAGDGAAGIEIDSAVAHGVDLIELERMVKATGGTWTDL